jgi:ribonuclease Z
LEVIILGSGSALPLPQRNPASLFLKHEGLTCLFDCGEGTQHRMHEYGIKIMRLKYIFISHLHGDHIFGLPGLLSTLDMYGRVKTLKVYGPSGIKAYIEDSLKPSQMELRYPLVIEELSNSPYYFELSDTFSVESFPLEHSIPTLGYCLKMKKSRAVYDSSAEQLTLYDNKFGYITDTLFSESHAKFVQSASLLYHEATFANAELENAVRTKHSTAEEAAKLALIAEASQLIIGHFSARYRDIDSHLEQARAIFPATVPAIEGTKYIV